MSRFIHMHIRRSKSFSSMQRMLSAVWNLRRSVQIIYSADIDLQNLCQLLESSTKLMWHHPISILIPSCPHFVGQSDTCNISMGGLCFPLLMQWRLSDSVSIFIPEWRAASPDDLAFHINIHEFIALIINDFFIMISFAKL